MERPEPPSGTAGLRRVAASVLAVALLSPAAFLVPAPVSAHTEPRKEGPAVFFVPHQDDEMLMYGPDLKNHVLAGRRTIAVLLSDGSASRVCELRYGDDRAACTAERDEEFRNAMEVLGVEAVIPPDRALDGELTEEYAGRLMRHYLKRFPRAVLRAPSPRDTHADHAAIGRALRALPLMRDKRFYLKPALWAEYPDLGRWTRRRNVNFALDAYRGFGHLSAPEGFDEQYGGARASLDETNVNQGGADARYHR